jgi:hypothetical protein
MLTNIAMQLASDLKLHLPSSEPTNVSATCFKPQYWPKCQQGIRVQTNEDRRALLATFLLYST